MSYMIEKLFYHLLLSESLLSVSLMCNCIFSVCGFPSQKSESSVLILRSLRSVCITVSSLFVSVLLVVYSFTESGLE